MRIHSRGVKYKDTEGKVGPRVRGTGLVQTAQGRQIGYKRNSAQEEATKLLEGHPSIAICVGHVYHRLRVLVGEILAGGEHHCLQLVHLRGSECLERLRPDPCN